jgi:hypothetical protein
MSESAHPAQDSRQTCDCHQKLLGSLLCRHTSTWQFNTGVKEAKRAVSHHVCNYSVHGVLYATEAAGRASTTTTCAGTGAICATRATGRVGVGSTAVLSYDTI